MIRARHLAAHRRDDAGFTLVEALVVLGLAAVVGIAATTIIASSMNLVAFTEVRAATRGQASDALADFTRIVRDADRVEVATATQLTVDYRAEASCDRHTWRLVADDAHPGQLSLRHTMARVGLSTGTGCADVADLLTSASPSFDRIEVDELDPNSRLQFFDAAGVEAPRPGDPGYSPATETPACALGSAQLLLGVTVIDGTRREAATDITRVALLSNVRGIGC